MSSVKYLQGKWISQIYYRSNSMNIYLKCWFKMLPMQLFEMPILSIDCWLTFAYMVLTIIDSLVSKYNPTNFLDSHHLLWSSSAQQSFFEKKNFN